MTSYFTRLTKDELATFCTIHNIELQLSNPRPKREDVIKALEEKFGVGYKPSEQDPKPTRYREKNTEESSSNSGLNQSTSNVGLNQSNSNAGSNQSSSNAGSNQGNLVTNTGGSVTVSNFSVISLENRFAEIMNNLKSMEQAVLSLNGRKTTAVESVFTPRKFTREGANHEYSVLYKLGRNMEKIKVLLDNEDVEDEVYALVEESFNIAVKRSISLQLAERTGDYNLSTIYEDWSEFESDPLLKLDLEGIKKARKELRKSFGGEKKKEDKKKYTAGKEKEERRYHPYNTVVPVQNQAIPFYSYGMPMLTHAANNTTWADQNYTAGGNNRAMISNNAMSNGQNQGQRSNFFSGVTCHHCGKPGHYKRECPQLQNSSNKGLGSNLYETCSFIAQVNLAKTDTPDIESISGRLCKFSKFWEEEVQPSLEVLNWIQNGVDMPVDESALQGLSYGANVINTKEERDFVEEEILQMLRSGAIESLGPIEEASPKWISAILVVPKAGKSKYRLVVNMKTVNLAFSKPESIKLDGVEEACRISSQNCWYASCDLSKGYFHVAVQDELADYFCIQYGRSGFQVQGVAVWMEPLAKNFPKDNYIIFEIPEKKVRNQLVGVSGRFFVHFVRKDDSYEMAADCGETVEVSRFLQSFRERMFLPNTSHNILGIGNQFCRFDVTHTSREARETEKSFEWCYLFKVIDCKAACLFDWIVEFCGSCCKVCSLVLEECLQSNLLLYFWFATLLMEQVDCITRDYFVRFKTCAREYCQLEWSSLQKSSNYGSSDDGRFQEWLWWDTREYWGQDSWFLGTRDCKGTYLSVGDESFDCSFVCFPAFIREQKSALQSRQHHYPLRFAKDEVKQRSVRPNGTLVLEDRDEAQHISRFGVRQISRQYSRSAVQAQPKSRVGFNTSSIPKNMYRVESLANNRPFRKPVKLEVTKILNKGGERFLSNRLEQRNQLLLPSVQTNKLVAGYNRRATLQSYTDTPTVEQALHTKVESVHRAIGLIEQYRFPSVSKQLRTLEKPLLEDSCKSGRHNPIVGPFKVDVKLINPFSMMVNSVSENTYSSYRSYFKVIEDYSRRNNVCLPFDEERCIDLILDYFKQKGKPKALLVLRSALAFVHSVTGWQHDQISKSDRVGKVLTSCENISATRKLESRSPVSMVMLKLWISREANITKFISKDSYLMVAAMLVIGLRTFCRGGELADLDICHITEDERNGMKGLHIKFVRTKTKKAGRSLFIEAIPTVGLNAPRGCCPVAIIQRYLKMRESLFSNVPALFVDEKGKRITKPLIGLWLTEVAEWANVPGRFTSHSLRIGAATEGALAGLSRECIMALGDWSSTAVDRYFRSNIVTNLNISSQMGFA